MTAYDFLKNRKQPKPLSAKAFSDLSGSLDPGKVFRERAKKLATDASDFEKSTGIVYLYELLGSDFFKSLSLRLDPTRVFKDSRKMISPITRYRTGGPRGGFGSSYFLSTTHTVFSDAHNDEPHPGSFDLVLNETFPREILGSFQTPDREWVIGDTTIATRPKGVNFGEFEMFIPEITAVGPNTVIQTDTIDDHYTPNLSNEVFHDLDTRTKTFERVNIGGVFPTSNPIDFAGYESEVARNFVLPYYLPQLLANALPGARSFQGLYFVFELKDLPRMLKSSLEAILHSPLTSGKKNLPQFLGDQYLNYKFGWESLYRDIRKMMSLPTQITKKVNYLISRSGKDTTYRSSIKFDSDTIPGSAPTFGVYLAPFEDIISSKVSLSRKGEIRCVVNNTLNLPPLEIPEVRAELLDQLWGLNMTPEDVYNIIPWSWLLDYFTGLGEYIRVISSLSDDRLRVNYGFMTYVSNVIGTQTLTTGVTNKLRTRLVPDGLVFVDSESVQEYTYGSTFAYKYQLRVDIASLDGVKTYWNPDHLSASQQAIIAALVTSRTR